MAEEKLSAEEVKEAWVLSSCNLNFKKYTHFTRFVIRYLSAPTFSVYYEKLFSETGKQKRNQLLENNNGQLLFLLNNLKKQK